MCVYCFSTFASLLFVLLYLLNHTPLPGISFFLLMHFHCLFVFQFNSRFFFLFFPLFVFAFWMHWNSQASSHLWEDAQLSQWRIWSYWWRWSQQGRSHSTVGLQNLPYCEGYQTGKCQLLCPTVLFLNISINNGQTNKQHFLIAESFLLALSTICQAFSPSQRLLI